jgi:hypothetical protein
MAPEAIPKSELFVHHPLIPGNSGGIRLGIQMRKVALLAAFALSVVFANTSSSNAATDEELYNLNKNSHMFVRDLWNPYAATSAPTAATKGKKVAKKKSKK